jgi:uncharacterized metal-binding protein
MVTLPGRKVGVVSCSGEGCIEGTVSRIATRLVLEKLRPEDTVTICLPLFLAGGKEERAFAKEYPTITVDGCDKLCAKIGTERHSGKIASSIVITDLTDSGKCVQSKSKRKLDKEDLALAERVAEKIAQEVDKALNRGDR